MSPINNPKRQAILEAATRAFINHGYSKVSMEAIAEAAPVSKPTLYNHFKSKQDLFAAVIACRCEALLSTLTRVKTDLKDPASGLRAIAAAFIELVYASESIQLYRLIIAEQQYFPELGALIYRSGPEPVLSHLSSYLAELNTRKIVKIADIETSSHLFLDMLKGDQHFRCLLGLQTDLSETAKQLLIGSTVNLFLKGHGYEA
jgi:TetR/AcrR family transcriptional regulator, mexJK operon transcriptional repressor